MNVDIEKIRKTWPIEDCFGDVTLAQRNLIQSACDELEQLRTIAKELAEALRVYHGCAYPVSTEINERGYNWSSAYLDQAKPIGEKALTKYRELNL